jgi:hypothetical protein
MRKYSYSMDSSMGEIMALFSWYENKHRNKNQPNESKPIQLNHNMWPVARIGIQTRCNNPVVAKTTINHGVKIANDSPSFSTLITTKQTS